jgi:Tol biopolymer transport system component
MRRAVLFSLGLGLLVLGMVCAVPAGAAVLSPGRILYSDAGGPAVRSVAPDGSAPAVVAMSPTASVDTFSRSADGRYVAIADTSPQVWILPADGSSAGVVIADASAPAFSPDASDRLAYLGNAGRLLIANPDGTTLLPARASHIRAPATWSPDGSQVVVDGLERLGATPALASLRGNLYPGATPAWSPNERRIAFVTLSGRLEVGPARGGCCATAITRVRTAASNVPVAWSPDSGRIAFMKQLPFAQADVTVATLPRRGHKLRVRRIGRGDSAGGLSFSPDGASLAYDRASTGPNGANLYASPVATPKPTLVASGAANPLWVAG